MKKRGAIKRIIKENAKFVNRMLAFGTTTKTERAIADLAINQVTICRILLGRDAA